MDYSWSKRSKLTGYLALAGGVILSLSLPKAVYEPMQSAFVAFYSRFFRAKRSTVLTTCDTEVLLLKEKVLLLEERLKSYEVLVHKPLLFPEILSAYFHHLIPCRAVYRDPAYWGSSLWVNQGKLSGVQKQSPVVQGNILVGLVDYVGDHQARVRLVTDVGMKPSVIAVRGGIQSAVARRTLQTLARQLEALPVSLLSEKEKYAHLYQLEQLAARLPSGDDAFLLRGILSGCGGPLWKPQSTLLQGEGFCFQAGKTMLPGDILVTTGLDGVFPPGLLVASVTRIFPPNEGACAFRLEAQSLVQDDTDLTLFILPPMEFNPNDRPDIFGSLWDN